MATFVTDIKKIQQQLEEATSSFVKNSKAFSLGTFNTKPSVNEWSAAQVADHVTKSNTSISKALQLKGEPANRPPDERVDELQKIFLDFKTKLKSPSFILPDEELFSRETTLATLEHSISKLMQLVNEENVSTMINHPAFGDITKLEIIHFVIYHTQRHTHQLQNIFRALNK